MSIDDIKKYLEENLTDKKYKHSLGVMKAAESLAKKWNVDTKKAVYAGLLHDIAKNFESDKYLQLAKEYNIELTDIAKDSPKILHGEIGAYIASTVIGIKDEEILHAIKVHTTGCLDMSMLDKIIYIADYIEENRTTIEIPELEELRRLAFEDIDGAMILGMGMVIKNLIETNRLISMVTVQERNRLIKDRK